MMYFIIFTGDYNLITFLFIAFFIFFVPLIFKYRFYPERSIYIYLFLWIIFPKTIRYLPFIGTYDLAGFGYFDVLQTIFLFHILILLLKKGYKNISSITIPINLKRYIVYFSIILLFTTIFGSLRYFITVPVSERIVFGNLIQNFFNPFAGLIFFIGLFAFIKNLKHIENIIYILALSGIFILLEHFIISELNLFSNLNVWAYSSDNLRFNSLIYSSYDLKGTFCVLSSISILYIAVTKKKYYLLILVFLMILPISSTFQRTPYLGYFISIIFFLFIYIRSKRLKFKISLILISFLFISISLSDNSISNKIESYVSGDGIVRKNGVFELQSLYDRFGLWYRAIDVFINYFPFGVGEGMFEIYSVGSLTPEISKPIVFSRSFSSYKSVTGFKKTKPHNVYIQFISEYNIFGLIILFLFIIQLFKYLNKKNNISNRSLKSFVYSIVIGIGIMSFFDSFISLYFLYGLLMFLAFTLSRSEFA